jgi:hypothetical protein
LVPYLLDNYVESGKTASIKDAAEKAAKQLPTMAPSFSSGAFDRAARLSSSRMSSSMRARTPLVTGLSLGAVDPYYVSLVPYLLDNYVESGKTASIKDEFIEDVVVDESAHALGADVRCDSGSGRSTS